MLSIKSVFAAFALLLSATLAAAPAAIAQGTNVIVIERTKIFAQSKVGQDIRTKLGGIEAAMQGELKPIADQLQAEGTALENKTQGMTREAILADAALTAEVEVFARNSTDFNRRRQIVAQELALTERKALVDFNSVLVPVLQEVIAERAANVILDKSEVVFVDDATDVTDSVIEKLDAVTPTMTVVRQTVPTQQPQQ
ncbi:MAG: OmpH family outer membrane protein [Pseudomonadota bacterium]